MVEVGHVSEIHRYPVKSLVGERLEGAHLERRGLAGDRLWSVRDPDGKFGSGKSTRRFRRMDGLLDLVARYDGQVPVLTFPDGRDVRGDDPAVHELLSNHVGRPVTLGREADVSHFDEGPLHLLTTAALDALATEHGAPVDARRFRPSLVVDTAATGASGFVEESWAGARLGVGDAVLAVTGPMPRCVMVTLPQRDLAGDDGLLRTVTEVNAMNLGVVADVLEPGDVAVGDAVRLLGPLS